MLRAILQFLFGSPRREGCQVFCPTCRNELTSGPARYWEDKHGHVNYECNMCTTRSRWDFDLPVPVLLETIR